jgi:glycerol kinase
MNNTLDQPISMLKVDGGACENNFLMQYQADLLGIPIERPAIKDITHIPHFQLAHWIFKRDNRAFKSSNQIIVSISQLDSQ